MIHIKHINMTQVPPVISCKTFDISKLKLYTNYHVGYNRRSLILSTPILECPFGSSTNNGDEGYQLFKLIVPPTSPLRHVISKLDQFALDKIKQGAFDDEITYQSPLIEKDGITYMNLFAGKDSFAVWDNQNNQMKSYGSVIANKFSGRFIMIFDSLELVKDNRVVWQYHAGQLKLADYSPLPPGCLIFDDVEKIESHLKERRNKDYEQQLSNLPILDIEEPESGTIHNELLD